MYFDPELVVQNEDLSIADGAIAPWATMTYMQPVLEALAAHYQFSLDQPWKTIPAKVRKAILYGSGDRRDRIQLSARRATATATRSRSRACCAGSTGATRRPSPESIREVLEGVHEYAAVPGLQRGAA